MDNLGMFEVIDVDGKPRFALRNGLTTNDLFAAIEKMIVAPRIIAVIKDAQRKRIL